MSNLFRVSAWVTNSLLCTCSARASHAHTLINVNRFSCPVLHVWVTNSLSRTRSARKPRSHSYKCQPFFVSLHACLPASRFRYILHSYKCQIFLVSLPGSQTVYRVRVARARASHARTIINVNPFSCPCLPACVKNSLSCACSARAQATLTLL